MLIPKLLENHYLNAINENGSGPSKKEATKDLKRKKKEFSVANHAFMKQMKENISVVNRKLAKNKIKQVNDFVEVQEQARLNRLLTFDNPRALDYEK